MREETVVVLARVGDLAGRHRLRPEAHDGGRLHGLGSGVGQRDADRGQCPGRLHFIDDAGDRGRSRRAVGSGRSDAHLLAGLHFAAEFARFLEERQ